MGLLDLPSRWVYVYYENGRTEYVANQDTLTREEAAKFKEYWEKARGMKVVTVGLFSSNRKIVKRFEF